MFCIIMREFTTNSPVVHGDGFYPHEGKRSVRGVSDMAIIYVEYRYPNVPAGLSYDAEIRRLHHPLGYGPALHLTVTSRHQNLTITPLREICQTSNYDVRVKSRDRWLDWIALNSCHMSNSEIVNVTVERSYHFDFFLVLLFVLHSGSDKV